MDAAGFRPPVLVGGAAVEIYTRGAVMTGDFDFACGRQDIFEKLLQQHGFVRPVPEAQRRAAGYILRSNWALKSWLMFCWAAWLTVI